MIYILTGHIRTGKTTALLNWSKNRSDVDGVLCPDDENGKRYFLKIISQEKIPLEVEDNSQAEQSEIIQVGHFKFLKSAFESANDYLISSGKKRISNYIIIDELGKLELQNEGLHASAEKLVKTFETNETHHLVLVVRSSLLDEIIQKYQISNYELIEKDNLNNVI